MTTPKELLIAWRGLPHAKTVSFIGSLPEVFAGAALFAEGFTSGNPVSVIAIGLLGIGDAEDGEGEQWELVLTYEVLENGTQSVMQTEGGAS